MTALVPPLDYLRWEAEVRDPAGIAIAAGKAITRTWSVDRWIRAEYTVAPIPAGWAYTCTAYANCCSMGRPLRGPYPTRQVAEDAAIESLLPWLDEVARLDGADGSAAARLARLIRADVSQDALVEWSAS